MGQSLRYDMYPVKFNANEGVLTEERVMTPETAKTDAEIVLLSLKQKEYFADLMERYEAKLLRYINRLGVSRTEDREDILQEIFIKVYRNLHAFDQKLSFSSWIYRIAHNETMSWFRKRRVRPEHTLVDDGDAVLNMISSDERTDDVHQHRETEDVVRRALDALPEKYRTALLLRFFEEKSYEEIADIIEVPVGTVATLVHRGKQQLRTLLDGERTRYGT